MISKSCKTIILLSLLINFISVSKAAIYTITVTGLVDKITYKNGFQLDNSITIGTQMTGTCTFNSQDYIEQPWNNVEYPLCDIEMTIGNYTFKHNYLSDGNAFLTDYADDYIFAADSDRCIFDGTLFDYSTPKTCQDINWSYNSMDLFNVWTYTAQDSIDKFFTSIDYYDIRKYFYVSLNEQHPTISWENDGSIYLHGNLTSMSITTPEPATIILLTSGALIIRKRSRL